MATAGTSPQALAFPPFESFETEEARAIENLQTYYEQWVAATRLLDTTLKGSLRWKAVGAKQYLYHRVSSNPLVDLSLGPRNADTHARMLEFKHEQAASRARQQAALAESLKFAQILRSMKLGNVDKQAAALLRHFDRKAMLGDLLLVVGTNAMLAYEVEAGGRIFRGYDATQDFDLTWRGQPALQLQANVHGNAQAGAQAEIRPPVSLIGTLREVDRLYTVNSERTFQATTGKYEVEFLAAPSTIQTFPFAKGDVAPMGNIAEQEWLMLGRPLRHVVAASDGTPAPICAPDPRWMALHKLWLSQKPQRRATKKPKDEAQGLLLLRAVVEAMASYPVDLEFIAQVEETLRPFLHMGLKWVRENPSRPRGDGMLRGVDAAVWRKLRRMPAAPVVHARGLAAGVPDKKPARMRY